MLHSILDDDCFHKISVIILNPCVCLIRLNTQTLVGIYKNFKLLNDLHISASVGVYFRNANYKIIP